MADGRQERACVIPVEPRQKMARLERVRALAIDAQNIQEVPVRRAQAPFPLLPPPLALPIAKTPEVRARPPKGARPYTLV